MLSAISVYLALTHLNVGRRKESAYLAVMIQFIVLSLGFVFLIAPFQTDELLFDFYSAQLILKGGNPYLPNALHNVFRYYSVPYSFRTPLTTGGYAKGLFYPALSALILLPAALLKIDPRYEIFAFTIGIVFLAFFFMKRRNLQDFFPMLALLLISDVGVLTFAGYSDVDIFWAFFFNHNPDYSGKDLCPFSHHGNSIGAQADHLGFFPFLYNFYLEGEGF